MIRLLGAGFHASAFVVLIAVRVAAFCFGAALTAFVYGAHVAVHQ